MRRPSPRQRVRDFYRALFPEGQTPTLIALAVFTGAFIGVLPTLGIAIPLTALVASICRLPKGPALVASFVATPPTLFLFFYPLGYFVGRALTHPAKVQLDFLAEFKTITLVTMGEVVGRLWQDARGHVWAFLLGMLIVALVTAAGLAAISYWIIVRRRPDQPLPPN